MAEGDRLEPDIIGAKPMSGTGHFSIDSTHTPAEAWSSDIQRRFNGSFSTREHSFVGFVSMSFLSEVPVDVNELINRYYNYPHVTGAIGVFYAIVGFQWITSDLANGETCWNNRRCEWRGALKVTNWNGVVSNIAYIILGMFIVVYVLLGRCMSDANVRVQRCQQGYGHFCTAYRDMYFNAAIAIVSEGFCSAIYHMCPARKTTQFDYVGITMVGACLFFMVYAKRHPNLMPAGAYASAMANVCFVSGLDVLGKYGGYQELGFLSPIAWSLAIFFHTIIMPRYFTLLFFGLSSVIPNRSELNYMWNTGFLAYLRQFRDAAGTFSSIFFLAFWLLGIVWLILACSFGMIVSYSLMVLVFVGSITYSMVHLFACGEWKQTRTLWSEGRSHMLCVSVWLVYAVSLLCGLVGFYFFIIPSNWTYDVLLDLTESDALGKDCILYFGSVGFDYHDLWHLLSSISLTGFCLASILGDELFKEVPRSKMRVV